MSKHTIMWFAERAARAYLISLAEFWTVSDAWQLGIAQDKAWSVENRVYRGRENRDAEDQEGQESSLKVRPCIVVSCTAAEAVLQNFHGIWTPALTVAVEANRAKTTGDDADAQAEEIFALFLTSSIIPDLSGATPGFFVRDVIPKDVQLKAEGRAWITEMSFSLEQATKTN